jgi:hypothetical protein
MDDFGYDGPPPIPIEVLERDYPPELGFRCSHGWHRAGGKWVPVAIVEFPDGSIVQFFPELSDRDQP